MLLNSLSILPVQTILTIHKTISFNLAYFSVPLLCLVTLNLAKETFMRFTRVMSWPMLIGLSTVLLYNTCTYSALSNGCIWFKHYMYQQDCKYEAKQKTMRIKRVEQSWTQFGIPKQRYWQIGSVGLVSSVGRAMLIRGLQVQIYQPVQICIK